VFSFSKMIAPISDDSTRALLLEHLLRRGKMTWQTILGAPREGLGREQIPVHQFRAFIQAACPPDLEKLWVFRCSDVVRLIGYRVEQVFYVIYLDHDHSAY
jgi:hypothetical protein